MEYPHSGVSLERGGDMSSHGERHVGLAAGPDIVQSLKSRGECLNPLSQISDQLY